MLKTKFFDLDGELDATQACQDQLPIDHDIDSFFLFVPFGRYLDPWDSLVTQEPQKFMALLSAHSHHSSIGAGLPSGPIVSGGLLNGTSSNYGNLSTLLSLSSCSG